MPFACFRRVGAVGGPKNIFILSSYATFCLQGSTSEETELLCTYISDAGKFVRHIDLWDSVENQNFFSWEAFCNVMGQLGDLTRTPAGLDSPSYMVMKKFKAYEVRRRRSPDSIMPFVALYWQVRQPFSWQFLLFLNGKSSSGQDTIWFACLDDGKRQPCSILWPHQLRAMRVNQPNVLVSWGIYPSDAQVRAVHRRRGASCRSPSR